MDLSSYVESVRAGVQNAAALADDHTKQVAEHLGTAVESSSRLALLQAISDAAAEISTELAPGSVEVRMHGSEPTFVVATPTISHSDPVTMLMPQDPSAAEPPFEGDESVDADEAQARVSLRLPQSVKEKVDQYADADGVSTNTWLLHRVLEVLAERANPRGGGWGVDIGPGRVRLSGPSAPTPPTPPTPPISFPAGFPFGDRSESRGDRRDRSDRSERGARGRDRGDRGRDRGDRADRPSNRPQRDDRGRGSVQGWVR